MATLTLLFFENHIFQIFKSLILLLSAMKTNIKLTENEDQIASYHKN